jgi:membrane peptidoglycan carboxypeptidase
VPLTAEQSKKLRKRRRRRKVLLISSLVVLMLLMAAGGVGYAALQVPLPNLQAAKQVSVIYYADGKTELARIGVENREEVKLDDVPEHLQRAVIAAEDRSFLENDGVSIRGTLRALWSNVRGEELQGGSTITMQFVKNAFLTQDRTFTNKSKQILLALKMDREYSKDQIMEDYLNTIFWGRGAYGVQAAAKAYFGVEVDKLTVEQSALLAGIIQAPNSLDPENNPAGAQTRWEYVIDGMVEKSWLEASEAETMQLPTTTPKAEARANAGLKGVTGTIMTRIQAELLQSGISEQQLNTGGLRITTTIDPKMQTALNKTVEKNMAGQPANLATGVVATEPGTGKIKAYYGGDNGFEQFDVAGPKAPHPAGSSFKIHVLAKALEEGISINSVWDGRSPRSFTGRDKPVNNSENNNSCRACTLDEATVLSLNTAYYAVTREVGASNVAELAGRAGITKLDGEPIEQIKSQVNDNIGIGQYGVSVIDHSAGFATFASGGVYAKPHFVQSVTQGEGMLYEATNETRRAVSADIAADVDTVLQHVVENGDPLAGGREAGGKTGTHQYLDTGKNSHAWMAGFTPQLSTAVWVGNSGADGAIVDKRGRNIFGSGLPTDIWKSFMDSALSGMKKEKFPEPAYVGDESKGDAKPPPPPPPAPSPTPEPTLPPEPSDPTELPGPENFRPEDEDGFLGRPRSPEEPVPPGNDGPRRGPDPRQRD